MIGQEAFFIKTGLGQRFCLLHVPERTADVAQTPRGMVLYLHPFAEEMNRSRAIAAGQARAFAHAGYAVLQMDMYGCGDSSGDFSDATWEAWVEDGLLGLSVLQKRFSGPVWLWGLRSGCLVASELARTMNDKAGLLFWQPWLSGRQGLQQFMRLGMAADLLEGKEKGATDRMRQQLAQGESIEIAGYGVSPVLAKGLEAAALLPPQTECGLVWVEINAREGAGLSPGSEAVIQKWQGLGHQVLARAVSCAPFWQVNASPAVDVLNVLYETSTAALSGCSPS